MPLQPPVIVLPGITGTVLEDTYPVSPEEVWGTVLQKQYDRIALHPDDRRYEVLEPARILARNPFSLVYTDLVEELRHDLKKKQDRDVPVYPFGYDWRKDCRQNAAVLGDFIDEVLARAGLTPPYQDDPPPAVDLVGHSMGGLILAAYLRAKQDSNMPSKVRRVVTIATPFHGAIDAIQKITTGMGALTGPPRDREREMARTITGLYQLLPTYKGAVSASAGLPDDLFNIDTWQPSVLQTLREFIRVYKAKISAEDLLKSYLKAAKDFTAFVNGINPAKVLPDGASNWLPIVGVDEETHIEAKIEPYKKQPWFTFPPAVNEGPGSERTGDGSVPFLGASPDFLERDRLVCITRKELTFWELRDRLLIDVSGLHAFLPKVNMIQRITARFLREDFDTDCEARPAPGVTNPVWPRWLKMKS